MLKVGYKKMFEKTKETLISLLLNERKPNKKISKITDFSDIMTLKVANDILSSFCKTKLNSFNSCKIFIYNSINK